MAGYPINGILGLVTSWQGTMATQLIGTAVRPYEFNISCNGEPADITGFSSSATAAEYVSGLRDATFDFSSWYPLTAPVLGNTGLVTFASGYVLFCKSWWLEIDFGEAPITGFDAAAVAGWRTYMPVQKFNWKCGWVARAASGTPISLPPTTNTAAAAATFKIKECGAADSSLSGTIVVATVSQPVKTRGESEVTYTANGSGDLTNTVGTSGGPGLLRATTGVVTPSVLDWDADSDGVPDTVVTLQSHTSRILTAPAFLRRLRIDVAADAPVKVNGTGRIAGIVSMDGTPV